MPDPLHDRSRAEVIGGAGDMDETHGVEATLFPNIQGNAPLPTRDGLATVAATGAPRDDNVSNYRRVYFLLAGQNRLIVDLLADDFVLQLSLYASGASSFQLTQAVGGGDADPTLDVYNGTVSAIPLPAAAWLFGSALLGLVTVARRKRLKA